ncbi:NYN domain-containing protein [Pisolithus marmoratus]|nr:NYN domain-containing protein [Pisolithus marmoratus]
MVNREKVAIFWDFENCCPPSTQGLGYDIANNIGRIARVFGCVTTFKAYLDISTQPSRSTALRSELQLSGVSVVDCPHNGKKDVVDKMAIVDMFAFAVDNPPPATVILVAGDRDYAYALSTLRLRNYRVVLITPCATSCLEACASFVIDWSVVLTKTRMESNTDAVRRPYVDIEANLLNRLSREVSQFGDNLTVVSATPKEIKSQRSGSQGLVRLSFADNDANVTCESKFTEGASEGTDQCTNGNDDSSVSVTSASKVPASPHRSSMSLPSPLRTRSASIRSEAVSKPSGQSSRLFAENLSPPPDTRLKVSDGADASTKSSGTFVPSGGENQQSSKDEPLSSIPSGSPDVKTPPPPATFNCSSRPHPDPLLNPKLSMSSTPFTSSGTRSIPGRTMVSLSDTSQEMQSVDIPTPEIERMASPLSRSSPPIFAVGADLATVPCLPPGDHPPGNVLIAGRSPSPHRSSRQKNPSDSGHIIPLVSLKGDDEIAGESLINCRNSVPTPKATNSTAGKQSMPLNSTEGIPKESTSSVNPSSVSLPTSHATCGAVPGSPAAQTPILPASSISTSATTEQASREKIRWRFLPLIRLLGADRHRGVFRSSRSDVAMALQVDQNAYKRVGVTKFKSYTTLAERAGLVLLGGVEGRRGGDTWIALHPDWFSEGEKTECQFNTWMKADSRTVDDNRTSTPG